tara:strand:+ start:188 stop:679 length:492 start_codon:yes stop_codon:yes gene_type:complete
MSQEAKDYINNVLAEKRQEFNNKAVCPFAKPELDANKLMIATVSKTKNLDVLIDEFHNSDYESALLIIKEDVPASQTKKFQIFINKFLKQKGLKQYKNICFNPNDKVSVEGYNPRSKAPFFMINIASQKVLSKGHKSLMKTNYYDRFPEEYLNFLQIDLKDKA